MSKKAAFYAQMKDYGKRRVPRNQWEFIDLILPHIKEGRIDMAVALLHSYSKRKKRNPNTDFETNGLLVYINFNYDHSISIQALCSKFLVSINEVPELLEVDVIKRAEDMLKSKYGSVRELLSVFIDRIEIDQHLCSIEVHYHQLAVLSYLVSEHDEYSRTWQYGIQNMRNDLCGQFLLRKAIEEILLAANTEVRIQNGLSPLLPKWKSEQLLFDRIKLVFPELVIIGQGSPTWLNGQRFDIWLPQISLAVEYNGKQHYESVGFFGGEVGYKKTKERDELKRSKCIENDTLLLEVADNYDFEMLVAQIRERLSERFKEKF